MAKEIMEMVENRVSNFVDVLYDDLKDIVKEDFRNVRVIATKENPTYNEIKKELSRQMFRDLMDSCVFVNKTLTK